MPRPGKIALELGLPYTRIGTYPTPLRLLQLLPAALGDVGSLSLKDDGLSSPLYGGNKVRKLELVLGEAIRRGAREVLTFGFAGSNHATATAVHASKLGMRGISMLLPQANPPYVATNLAVSEAVGAELHYYRSMPGLVAGVLWQLLRHRVHSGRWPFVIAPGGSSPLGTLGFVKAAFELVEQLERESSPPPDIVYVPFGSGGTAVGLALGFAAAGLSTRVAAVRVTEAKHANERKAAKLWRKTAALLVASDPSFPRIPFDRARLVIRDEFFGRGYAVVTREAAEAIELMKNHEGVQLDVTYTGKTLACLIADSRSGVLAGKHVLFWNTYNAADLTSLAARGSRARLPTRLRAYVPRTTL